MKKRGATNMTQSFDTTTIQHLFYKQIRTMTEKTAMRTVDTFNEQFSGRCFL